MNQIYLYNAILNPNKAQTHRGLWGQGYIKKQIKHNMKNIKLFEQYSQDYQTEMEIADSIYEDWKLDYNSSLNEAGEEEEEITEEPVMVAQEWDDEDDAPLSAGEKRALARDFQIMSKPQLAALYLRALGKADDDKEPNEYLVMVDGIEDFGSTEPNSGRFVLSIPALADAIGLDSYRTAQRTVNKFYNLITGVGETPSESTYEKLIRAYQEFEQRNPRQVAVLASEALQDPMMSTKNRDAAEAEGPRSAAKRAQQKRDQIKLGERVYSLINALKAGSEIFRNDIAKAQRAAMSRLSADLGMTLEQLDISYRAYLKDKNIMNQANYTGRR